MATPNGDSSNEPPDTKPTAAERRTNGRQGGLTGWARTVDRAARIAVPQKASPAHLEWHARQLGLDPDDLTPEELKRAEAARHAFMIGMSLKAKKARQRRKAERLRAQADELDRLAAEPESETA